MERRRGFDHAPQPLLLPLQAVARPRRVGGRPGGRPLVDPSPTIRPPAAAGADAVGRRGAATARPRQGDAGTPVKPIDDHETTGCSRCRRCPMRRRCEDDAAAGQPGPARGSIPPMSVGPRAAAHPDAVGRGGAAKTTRRRGCRARRWIPATTMRPGAVAGAEARRTQRRWEGAARAGWRGPISGSSLSARAEPRAAAPDVVVGRRGAPNVSRREAAGATDGSQRRP